MGHADGRRDNSSTLFSGVMSGAGGLKSWNGHDNICWCEHVHEATNIESGPLKVTGTLSDSTAVTGSGAPITLIQQTRSAQLLVKALWIWRVGSH